MYTICPQCSQAIKSITEYHCGHCNCCAKISATLRGDEAIHPAEVKAEIRQIQTGLQANEERVIAFDDPAAPKVITDRLRAGRWKRVFIHQRSDMWSLV